MARVLLLVVDDSITDPEWHRIATVITQDALAHECQEECEPGDCEELNNGIEALSMALHAAVDPGRKEP